MKSELKTILITIAIGIIIGFVIRGFFINEPELVSEEVEVRVDTTWVHDTLYTDPINYSSGHEVPDTTYLTPSKPGLDDSLEANKPLMVSKKTFPINKDKIKGEVTVEVIAPCKVESIKIDFDFQPIQITYETPVVSIDTIKTITKIIKPAWYETNTAGIVYGVLGTLGLVYVTGQLAN